MNKIIFITGASSGFGKACAEKVAEAGYNLIINARRTERLEALKKQLEARHKVKVQILAFDVRDRKSVFESVQSLPESWKWIDLLVNNAGLALGRDYFDEARLDDWNTMIDTNLKGLIYVTRAVLTVHDSQEKGHIINIGSTAGKEVYEKGNTYCATKYAVAAISQAMRIDLFRHQIKVTAIHPGRLKQNFRWCVLKAMRIRQLPFMKVLNHFWPKTFPMWYSIAPASLNMFALMSWFSPVPIRPIPFIYLKDNFGSIFALNYRCQNEV